MADLVEKTKKFIYYWINHTSRIDPALVDIYIKHAIKHAGRDIKIGDQANFDSFVDSIFRKFSPYIERQTIEKECLSYLDNIENSEKPLLIDSFKYY